MKSFKVIVTLGPAVSDKKKLKSINECGECIYRLNGAHFEKKQAARSIEQLRDILPDAKIMLDLPGNKVRTVELSEPIRLIKGECFNLYDYQINYSLFYTHLKKGDIVRANDSIFTLEVVEINKTTIKLLSHSEGILLSNKGLHVRGIHTDIPFLLERDHRLMDLVYSCSIDYLSLSFVRTASDIREVKKILNGQDVHIIAKIETQAAIDNLEHIFQEVESILIDRGDLSTDIDILKLAFIQEKVIEASLKAGKDVYLATQFLKNMETKPIPLISEIIDLCRTIMSGITGIQLSEETAVGKYPVECTKLVFDAFKNNVLIKDEKW